MFKKIFSWFRRDPLSKARPHYERALSYGDDYDNAIPELQKAIQIRPDYLEAYLALGKMHYQRGNYDQAIQNLDKAVELGSSDSETLVGRGLAREAQGDLAAALADYDRAIQAKPDECSTYLLRATARDKKGEYQGAAMDYSRVLDLTGDPDLRKKVQERLRSLGVRPPSAPAAAAQTQPAPAGSSSISGDSAASAATREAAPSPVQAFTEARTALLTLDPVAAGMSASKEAPDIWGIAMDIGFPDAIATLVSLSNGTTCLYFGNGEGTVDEGQNGAVVAASKALIIEAERWFKGMTKTTTFPLPALGMVKFYVLTYSGAFSADAPSSELTRGEHRLSPLFHISQEVLAQLQRSKGQK